MIANIANEFENITKFGLLQYFLDYRDFMQDDYSDVYAYYNGDTEKIDAAKMIRLQDLINRGHSLIRTFQTFSGKLGNSGYWELQQYCQNLYDLLQRIQKLPKYLRTSKTNRGYKPSVQVKRNVGTMKTIEDVANDMNSDNHIDIILNNDLEEEDYDIDKLSTINTMVDNKSEVVVRTILEAPIGKAVYGRDLKRKLTLTKDGDLDIAMYEDNVEQKSEILCELKAGDIPEKVTLGRSISEGKSNSQINYAAVMNDLEGVFAADELFSGVQVDNISQDNGSVNVKLSILTKYSYVTTKTITI